MTTRSLTLSPSSVTDLTATLSLVDGTYYLIQASAPGPMLLTEGATTPSISDAAHTVGMRETWTVMQEASLNLYAWGDCTLTITEADF